MPNGRVARDGNAQTIPPSPSPLKRPNIRDPHLASHGKSKGQRTPEKTPVLSCLELAL